MSSDATVPARENASRHIRLTAHASADAQVEMDAKMALGYFTSGSVADADELKKPKGRSLSV